MSQALTEQHILEQIRSYVRGAGAVADDDPGFTDQTDLFDSGYLDSLAVVALTTYLQDTFAVTLSEDDLFDPSFSTVGGMAAIVFSRR